MVKRPLQLLDLSTILSSHLPLFLSHQKRLPLTAAALFMFCFSQFIISNMTKRCSNLRPSSNQLSKRHSTANQQPNANNNDNSEQSSEHPTSMKLFYSFSTDGQTALPTLQLEHHSVILPPPFPFPSNKTDTDSCSSLYVLFFTIHHIEHDKTSLQPALIFQSIL